MDIKYVHVHGTGNKRVAVNRDGYLLAQSADPMLHQSIKKDDVLLMLSLMLLDYKAEGMSLRNDNGSQFIATPSGNI